MTAIQKTREVEQDLIEIWLYTAEKWGDAQADKYLHIIIAVLHEKMDLLTKLKKRLD